MLKSQNQEIIDKLSGIGGGSHTDLQLLKAKLQEAEEKYYQLSKEMTESDDQLNVDKKQYSKKKVTDTTYISQTQEDIIDYLNDLNIKIGHCKKTEVHL